MSAAIRPMQEAAIQQYAKQLRLPTLGGQFARLAGEAAKEKQSHLSYLEALLEGEVEERDRKASEQLAAQSVKDKYLSLFAKERDPLLFMGTTFPWNSWVVIGVFYPPLQRQGSFDFWTDEPLTD